MRESRTETTLYLLEPRDVQWDSLPPEIAPYRFCAEKVLTWTRTYLCQPHAALGREGAVCPYIDKSLDRGLFWMAIYPSSDPTPDDVATVMRKYRDWFLELDPVNSVEAEYKVIVLMFPNLSPANVHELIDVTQIALKPEFVTRGLMIGQFHGQCNEPGLWNQQFRPFRSPLPLLVIRNMVRWDAPFLTRDAWSLAAYLSRFGGNIPNRFRAQVREAAVALGVEHAECNLG